MEAFVVKVDCREIVFGVKEDQIVVAVFFWIARWLLLDAFDICCEIIPNYFIVVRIDLIAISFDVLAVQGTPTTISVIRLIAINGIG